MTYVAGAQFLSPCLTRDANDFFYWLGSQVSLFAFSRAAPVAYGGSQTMGLIGAVAASLRQSHSNMGSEPSLQPTPQLTATPDP